MPEIVWFILVVIAIAVLFAKVPVWLDGVDAKLWNFDRVVIIVALLFWLYTIVRPMFGH